MWVHRYDFVQHAKVFVFPRALQIGNNVGDSGAEVISERLKVSLSLKELYLVIMFCFCFIFLEYFKRQNLKGILKLLTAVLQQGNLISNKGAGKLAELLQSSSSIQGLFLVSVLVFCFLIF